MRRDKPRLPWKRGPAAWKIKLDADEIKIRLGMEKRNFFSLRRVARLLSVSTQPVRDWIRLGYLKREGPRGQIARGELGRFVGWLAERAESFEPENYFQRFPLTFPFKKLGDVHFSWPKESNALKPSELATLAGCHPSLVLQAIHYGRLRGRRRSPGRWEVSKHAWRNAFPLTLQPHQKKT
jgi:hypothetical protein